MTSFTRTWDSNYEGLPQNSESAKKGASRIREVRTDIAERMQVDHRWAGDQYDGQHLQVTMQALDADPTFPDGNKVGILYCKLQNNGGVELYYKDSNGNVTPITSSLSGVISVMTGTIIAVGNTTSIAEVAARKGDSYIFCDGQAVSRTDFSALFGAIGTIWGSGDGINTFNVPDLRGRALIGGGQGSGLTNRIAGQTMGEETHVLTIPELPAHTHQAALSGPANPGPVVAFQGATTSDTVGAVANTGSNQPHNNMQPSAVINWMIKT